jgi:hypothetical protein
MMAAAVMIAVFMISLSGVEAGTFTTNGLTADVSIGYSTNPLTLHILWVGETKLYNGGNVYDYNKGDRCSIMVFQLPDLGEESIASANLDFDGQRQWEDTWNIDLYGVRSSSSSTAVITNDYGFGQNPSGTLIQDNIMTPSDANNAWVSKSTDDTGDANLASWLIAQYAAVGAGGYVFIRFNPDNTVAIPTGDANLYMIASADSTTQAKPVLTITTQAGAKGFEIITK